MRRLAILLLLALTSLASNATHIVGGGFDYRKVPGQANNYVFRLTLYFDAINGNPNAVDPDVTCHIFGKGDALPTESIVMPLISQNQYLPFTNPECANGAEVLTRILVYELVVSLLPETYINPNGYYIIWERCCRNQIISNIFDPGQAGQTFYMEFPAVVKNSQPFLNSSPLFGNIYSDYPCLNQLFTISFGATDSNGDSLVYSLVNPLKGNSSSQSPVLSDAFPAPYAPVDWRPGYSALNAIPGNPALQINSKTGLLTCKPTLIGLFVFSVKCEEFRNGKKIGEVRREMQLLVKDCPQNTPPTLSINDEDKPLSSGDTLRLLSSVAKKCYTYKITEKQLNQRVKLTVLPLNSVIPNFFKDTTLTFSANHDTLEFNFCVPACTVTPPNQLWSILFLATDNGCPVSKSDTLALSIKIDQAPIEIPQITRLNQQSDTVLVLQTELLELSFQASQTQNGPITLSGYLIDSAGAFIPIGENGVILPSGTGSSTVSGKFVWPEICYLPEHQPLKLATIATSFKCDLVGADTNYTWIYILKKQPIVQLTSTGPVDNIIQLSPGQSSRFQLKGYVSENRIVSNRAFGSLSMLDGFRFSPSSNADSTLSDFQFEASCNTSGGQFSAFFVASNTFCNKSYEDSLIYTFQINPDSDSLGLIPNLITANDDGKNDGFSLEKILPRDNCYFNFDFVEIYNRWGNRIFYSNDRSFVWKPAAGVQGVFYFALHFKERYVKNWIVVSP